MGNRIFYGFLILVFSALLWLIPVTALIYDFRTDVTENGFYVVTGATATNSTVILTKAIYDDDVTTLEALSDLETDIPTYASYNSTTRATVFTNLTANTTRTLSVFYDTDALNSSAWGTILDIFPKIWMILIIAFPVAGLVAILIMRNN